MNSAFRIVFAYCSDDPWIAVIAQDLDHAAKALGHELYVIAAGDDCADGMASYINTDSFHHNSYFDKCFKRLSYSEVDVTDLAEMESLFLKHQAYGKKEFQHDIITTVRIWLAEAMVMLKIIQPDVIIVWNGLYYKRALYVKAARHLNIPVFYAEKGMLPNSWYTDVKGVSAWSSLAEKVGQEISVSGKTIEKINKKLISINATGESAWEQPQRKDPELVRLSLGLSHNQSIIFFPGQVDYDTNILLFSEQFKSSLAALQWLVDGLLNLDFFVLVKPHPKGNTTVKDYESVIQGKGKVLPEINVIDAIDIADCIVSINSTIAFEAAIRAKPVLLLGQGILHNKDFVSSYCPGKPSSQQIRECIEKYLKNRDGLHYSALSFAAYLDADCYAYRGNAATSMRLLKRLMRGLGKSNEKHFQKDEIAALFQEIPHGDFEQSFIQGLSSANLATWFPARALVKALFTKIKHRLIP